MQGRFRDKSRPQAQQQPRWRQDQFQGALNDDLPATAIEADELAVLEDLIAHPRYIEGRGGSQRYTNTVLPGTSPTRSWLQHPQTGKHLIHRQSQFFIAPASMSSWTEVKSVGPAQYTTGTIAGDTGSQLSGFTVRGATEDNTNAGTLYWNLTHSGAVSTLSVYKDAAKTSKVMEGTRSGTGALYLYQQNNSGIGAVGEVIAVGSDDTGAANQITTTYLGESFSDIPTKIIPFKNDFLVFGDNVGLLYVDATNEVYYDVGADNDEYRPFRALVGSGSQSSTTAYGRRYLATYSRIVDASTGLPDSTKDRVSGRIDFEGPSNILGAAGDLTDYAEYWGGFTIGAVYPMTVDLKRSSIPMGYYSAAHFTHLSLYGTLDIGSNGVDPVSGLGNNREIYAWMSDVEMTQHQFTDTISDEQLRARISTGRFGLKSRFFERMTLGKLGQVAGEFLMVAKSGEAKGSYCQLYEPRFVGYYNPAFQTFSVDDGIQEIVKSFDNFVVLCNRSTYSFAPQIHEDAGDLEPIFVMKSKRNVSDTIGVVDIGSISFLDTMSFMARCSDHAIRIFTGVQWDTANLADQKVSNIVKTMVNGSTGGYFAGAYLLWYRDSSNLGYNDKCLRLGLKREAGYGWSKITGDSWVYPDAGTSFVRGAQIIQDANGVQRLLVLDDRDGYFYWVETFTGHGITKQWRDKTDTSGGGGVDITPKLRFRELTGEEESHTCYHEETHLRLRSIFTLFMPGFKANVSGYANGAAAATEEVRNVPESGDIQFWNRLVGNRLQIEAEFTTSAFRLVSADTHYQSHDQKSIATGPHSTEDATRMETLAGYGTLKHWLTRPKNAKNRAAGTDYTASGTAITNTTGPDGKSYGLSFSDDSQYVQSDSTLYSDFTAMSWLRNMPEPNGSAGGSRLFRITGSTSLTIEWTADTTLSINGQTIATTNTDGDNWVHFAIVRRGSTCYVYQNCALHGTVSVSGTLGGTQMQIGGDGEMEIFDFRLYNTALHEDVITHYYREFSEDSGIKVLPRA